MDAYLEIKHFVHPEHPLILIDLKDSKTRGLIEAQKKIDWEKQRSESAAESTAEPAGDVSIWCVLCGNEMLDTSYSCIDCDIHLHKLCAKFPTKMMHPSHPQHPLTLTDHHRSFGCNICWNPGNGFSYYCRSCDFDVDVKCAKLPTEMMHPSHPQHPLTLTDQRSYRDFICNICSKPGNGFNYHCRSCDFDVDVKCAKSPTEMMHPSHPQHPLTLTDRHISFRCNICLNELGNRFSYYCRSCNFDVDVKCASRGEPINHKGHPHPLYPFLRTVLFRCDACGTEHSAAAGGVSYMCNTCNFWVHEDCATLPATVKYRHHVHPLSLVVDCPEDNPCWTECSICKEKFLDRWSQWIYKCGASCPHRVHTICLAKTLIAERNKTYEVDPDIDPTKVFHLTESFKYDDLVAQMIEHMTGENTALSKVKGPLICHFSHKHPLTLIHNDMPSINNKADVLCIACVLPISTPQVPYYSCTECNNYALHEWCAKLPIELLQHPAHPHPLILQGLSDQKSVRATDCPACGLHINGFSYRCRRDDKYTCRLFAMDIKCLLPPAILHKAHEHPLKLVENCENEGCVACPNQSDSLAYGCVSCCFYLHNACALKPIAIRHRYDKHHPFTSTSVEPVENRAEDDEYVCEFCEEDIDPKWWFHHCLQCDLSACSKCIFPKYGGRSHYNPHLTYSSPVHHHPLSYVKLDRRTNNTSLCALCQRPFIIFLQEFALQCAQCKVMFHMSDWECLSTKSRFPLVLQEGPSCH